ncbi:hypothetical protein CTI12_AA271610 [Artemisia annua]|uniref:Uncharacterized protein n=1 Tax=Artemisia annua TaxID=35608 RepID=A0A2U1NFK2_ARTAN|nr:hypothetical protein CTI12_AA271610 [Artemisia annua]
MPMSVDDGHDGVHQWNGGTSLATEHIAQSFSGEPHMAVTSSTYTVHAHATVVQVQQHAASTSNGQPRRNTPRTRRACATSRSTARVQNTRGAPDTYVSLGPCDRVCRHCKALFWFDERLKHGTVRFPEYHLCCMGGKVVLRPQP